MPKKTPRPSRPSQKPKSGRPKPRVADARPGLATDLVEDQEEAVEAAHTPEPDVKAPVRVSAAAAPSPRTRAATSGTRARVATRTGRTYESARLGDTTREYSFVRADVIRIAIVSAALFGVIVVLSFVLR